MKTPSAALSFLFLFVALIAMMLTSCTNPYLPPGSSASAGFSGTTKTGQTYYGNVTVPLGPKTPASGKEVISAQASGK